MLDGKHFVFVAQADGGGMDPAEAAATTALTLRAARCPYLKVCVGCGGLGGGRAASVGRRLGMGGGFVEGAARMPAVSSEGTPILYPVPPDCKSVSCDSSTRYGRLPPCSPPNHQMYIRLPHVKNTCNVSSPSHTSCPLHLRPQVTTFTGTQPDASTDARVYVDLYGERGHLMDLHLRDTGDTFNEGAEDCFFFPAPPGGLGELASACVSHDDSGGWARRWRR